MSTWIVISCVLVGIAFLGGGAVLMLIWLSRRDQAQKMQEKILYELLDKLHNGRLEDQRLLSGLKDQIWLAFQNYRDSFDRHQLQGFSLIQNNLQQNNNAITQKLDQLTETT